MHHLFATKPQFYRIVETDNFGGDYPDERFVLDLLDKKDAEAIAEVINSCLCTDDSSSRYYKVVEHPYTLQPGFEP